MMQKQITFEDLPAAIKLVDTKLNQVIDMLAQRIEKPEEIPKYLNVEKALKHLNALGFPVKKSTLYKLTSKNEIPFRKIGSRLIFTADSLDRWCEQTTSDIELNKINQIIFKHSLKLKSKTKQ